MNTKLSIRDWLLRKFFIGQGLAHREKNFPRLRLDSKIEQEWYDEGYFEKDRPRTRMDSK